MPVFAAIREGETRRVGESGLCAVDNLGNECQRLQGSKSEALDQQHESEIAEIQFTCDSQYSPEALQIDIFRQNVIVPSRDQIACFTQRRFYRFLCDRKKRLLCLCCARIETGD